jgi:hypothetical protein
MTLMGPRRALKRFKALGAFIVADSIAASRMSKVHPARAGQGPRKYPALALCRQNSTLRSCLAHDWENGNVADDKPSLGAGVLARCAL